jgi:hypothetical protein
LTVEVVADAVRLGPRLTVSFQRTLRIPDDGRTYPLPPGLGRFPVLRVGEFEERVPPEWRRLGGVFIPMYQREALWLAFDGAWWKPNAVQVGVGRVNAVSGTPWDEELTSSPQNYLVCPNQPWLDGINVGDGVIRQFVAMPLGTGSTVEGQVTGAEEYGGLQLRAYEPRPGRFPDRPPPEPDKIESGRPLASVASGAMGLGAGGQMHQRIYPDPSGVETWDPDASRSLHVHIVNSEQYEHITGRPPPPTPVTAERYTAHGLPWFELYDEGRGTIPAAEPLKRVKSVGEHAGEGPDPGVVIDPDQIRGIRPSSSRSDDTGQQATPS